MEHGVSVLGCCEKNWKKNPYALWRTSSGSSGAKAPSFAVRPVGNGPRQFLGTYVINRVRTTRLVHWLSWAFKTQERKKERMGLTRFIGCTPSTWAEREHSMFACPIFVTVTERAQVGTVVRKNPIQPHIPTGWWFNDEFLQRTTMSSIDDGENLYPCKGKNW